jgi:xylan 1,4-beta-xylosidase
MKKLIFSIVILILCFQQFLFAQVTNNPVVLTVDLAKETGPMYPVWAWFGYDEPNYTYMKDGQKLLTEISALSSVPVYVRVHNILTTDEGEPGLKWGSTNVYTEDKNGNPVYDWTKVDKIFDTFHERGMKPIVELGFMPKALSTHPEPYRHNWPKNPDIMEFSTGWAYPPNDFKKWEELVFQFTKHCISRYGENEIESWYFEVWNEPDVSIYWKGTSNEYFKLYDYSVSAVKKACPKAKVGGPTTTDPRNEGAATFYRAFLQHCLDGTNNVTGKKGSPLDYITFHAKGSPKLVDGHMQMNINPQLQSIAKGFEIVASFPKFKNLPIIIGESDPEGCAACAGANFGYRNGTVYSSYQAAVFAKTYELADFYKVNLIGAVTWAFEFEDKPWFAGYRDLATNGVDKPVLNIYRMFGMMSGTRLKVSGGKYDLKTMIDKGVKDADSDINALVCKDKNSVSMMVWNYHDEDLPAPPSSVEIAIAGLPDKKILVQEYRIDQENSNSYEVWKKMGSPQDPTLEQISELEKAGQLKLFASPEWIKANHVKTVMKIQLPRQGVSLLKFSWNNN